MGSIGAVIVAAGKGTRFGKDKLLVNLNGRPVIRHSVERFVQDERFERVVVVVGENKADVAAILDDLDVIMVEGGDTRARSVLNGVNACDCDIIAVHDGARPFVSQQVIDDTLAGLDSYDCTCPALAVTDTIKVATDGLVTDTPDRNTLFAVQTPQVFHRDHYLKATQSVDIAEYTDDCSLLEAAGYRVGLTTGCVCNKKITSPQDLQENVMRVGQGYDVHRLVSGRRLILGGVDIEHTHGLLGHSDADVLCHAISDALLGAAALGDIGKHFPDTDETYRGANSVQLLSQVAKLLRQDGYNIGNIDATVVAERPKLAPHIDAMRQNIAAATGVELSQVSVKATTQEGLGFCGRTEGIAAMAVATIV